MTYLSTLNLPPIEDLIPHRGTMLLIDRIVAFKSDSVSAEYAPRVDGWYVDQQGNMPAWIGIELMAQAIAAHVSLLNNSDGAPLQPGALVGTRSYHSVVPFFSVNEILSVHVTLIFRDSSGLGAYDCSISLGAEKQATATIKVFEPPDFLAYMQGDVS
jgi:predicted hotdog family 3-hydroxylacyl-ACP dehydratase